MKRRSPIGRGVVILTPSGARHLRYRIRPGVDMGTLCRLGCAKKGGCVRPAMFSTLQPRGGGYRYWCEVHGKRQHLPKNLEAIAGVIDADFEEEDDLHAGSSR